MADPVTFTVGGIAALAFTTFLVTSVGEATKKLTPAVITKIDALRDKIWRKLRGIPEVDELNATIENGDKVTEQQIRLLTPHLEAAMKEDAEFGEEIRQLASEIDQEINIGEILGENVMNVYGGSALQINDPKAPIFTGTINSPITFNTTNNNY
ncbi:MAG: hypothetical protein AAF329_27870 [Cyanobacteria bacterium P01_A01_bin.17]